MSADLPDLGRIKRLIAALGVGLALIVPVGVTALATIAVIASTTGADPRAALTEAPTVPAELDALVDWDADAAGLLRSVEPETRAAVGSAWLGALASLEPDADPALIETWLSGSALIHGRAQAEAGSLSSGPRWIGHRAHVHFYSLDGRIMGLEIESRGTVDVAGTAVTVVDHYDGVLVLQDGNWRVDALVVRARS